MNLRTADAMQITGASRQKFNEAVAGGYYKCSPEAEWRKSRTFDLDDLVGLRVFSDLLALEYPARVAGHYACSVVHHLRAHADLVSVFVVRTQHGETWKTWILPWFGDGNDKGRASYNPNHADASVAAVLELRVSLIREELSRRSNDLVQRKG